MAHDLPFVVPASVITMLKITRLTDTGTTTLIVSGRIRAERLFDLRRYVEAERPRDVVLDLSEVSLVDGEVVRFLLHCEMQGIRLAHCPAYVREWMVREKRPP
jgi:ABC-type transporter Mla MlaB component